MSHYTPASIKQAIKNTLSSATTRYGKSTKGGTSGFSGSKSYAQSKKGNTVQVHALDDDAIELTRQNNNWNRLSGGGDDLDLERGGSGGGGGSGSGAPPKTGMSVRSGDTWLQDASPTVNVRSSQDVFQSRDRLGTPNDGQITVTTEVRLTRD